MTFPSLTLPSRREVDDLEKSLSPFFFMENGAFLLANYSKGVTGTTNLIEIFHERRCLVFLGNPMHGVSEGSDLIGSVTFIVLP